jgi:hypothetical protein
MTTERRSSSQEIATQIAKDKEWDTTKQKYILEKAPQIAAATYCSGNPAMKRAAQIGVEVAGMIFDQVNKG